MVYRVDKLTECGINPFTGYGYDRSWIVLMLTDSEEYQFMCGSRNGCAYTIEEKYPIGIQLGDPADFSDYIMFGGGVIGEIVVNPKQHGKTAMDVNIDYLTGARLCFNAEKMAQDGLLVRDGCHLKVKDTLPLEPYLLFAATLVIIGIASQVSTPKIFS